MSLSRIAWTASTMPRESGDTLYGESAHANFIIAVDSLGKTTLSFYPKKADVPFRGWAETGDRKKAMALAQDLLDIADKMEIFR